MGLSMSLPRNVLRTIYHLGWRRRYRGRNECLLDTFLLFPKPER